MTVGDVLCDIARHPMRFLVRRWNWKAGLLSALLRGAVFFTTTLSVGVAEATRALMVDASFRVPMAGICAALVQALRRAEPSWLASLLVVAAVPALSHAAEISIHTVAATPQLWRGVGASVALSVASSAVELVLMRHDVMIVGPGSASLASDLRRILHFRRTGAA